MDFALTGEQEALRDTAAKYLADGRASAGSGQAWADAVGLGWLDPELGTVELALIAEQLGRAGSPLPWWATVGLAGPALGAAGRPVRRPATLAWAEPGGPDTLAAWIRAADGGAGSVAGGGEARTGAGSAAANGGRTAAGPAAAPAGTCPGSTCVVAADGTVTGHKIRVPHLVDAADVVVAAAGAHGVELRLVDGEHLHPRPVDAGPHGLDATRPVASVELAAVPSVPLVAPDRAADVLALTRRRALALLAAEGVGVAAQALATATGHAASRTQFGRPIGANQAVAHPLAEVYGQVETARSLAYRAAWSVDAESGPAADLAVVTATAAAREAATVACEAAIQTYGGSGFTWEQPLHRWYRRAWWLATFDGTVADFRAELAGLLLDGPGDTR
ncbi:acyl-CoA dehydrogenase family protein [Micromonospora globbae]|uniref:acyl-CoA dehydrogenase family protein n=1 Tax=Micromonospora globbae TaxID=1894969 RepID=UPI003443F4C4